MNQDNKNNNEPIILGELKKEKSSKPLFVILVFILVIGTCFYLLNIQYYLINGEGTIPNFYHKLVGNEDEEEEEIITKPTSTTTTTTTTKVVNEKLTLVKKDTILNIDNIYLENISINNNTLSYKITSRIDINLDKSFYFLEIYDSNENLLDTIKLSGTSSTASRVKNIELSFNTNESKYYVRLFNAANEELTPLNIESLTCQKDNNSYNFKFNNNLLIEITLNNSLINLNEDNDNYYTNNTTSTLIKYDMTHKGYDCK